MWGIPLSVVTHTNNYYKNFLMSKKLFPAVKGFLSVAGRDERELDRVNHLLSTVQTLPTHHGIHAHLCRGGGGSHPNSISL